MLELARLLAQRVQIGYRRAKRGSLRATDLRQLIVLQQMHPEALTHRLQRRKIHLFNRQLLLESGLITAFTGQQRLGEQ